MTYNLEWREYLLEVCSYNDCSLVNVNFGRASRIPSVLLFGGETRTWGRPQAPVPCFSVYFCMLSFSPELAILLSLAAIRSDSCSVPMCKLTTLFMRYQYILLEAVRLWEGF